MQVNLPSDADSLIHTKAAAAGFGDDISAYVTHLVTIDCPEALEETASERSAYDLAKQMGIIGMIKDAPSDLATNPKHMEGFGSDEEDPRPR